MIAPYARKRSQTDCKWHSLLRRCTIPTNVLCDLCFRNARARYGDMTFRAVTSWLFRGMCPHHGPWFGRWTQFVASFGQIRSASIVVLHPDHRVWDGHVQVYRHTSEPYWQKQAWKSRAELLWSYQGLPYDSRQPFISSETVGGQDMLVISPA